MARPIVTTAPESRQADRRKAEAAREGDFLLYAVVRPLMFIVWALVLWGTAIAAAGLYVLVARGPAAAMHLLLPRTPLELVNTGLGALALIVWIAVVAATRRASRERSATRPH